jgi:cytidylate kinase
MWHMAIRTPIIAHPASIVRVADVLEHAQRHWQATHKEAGLATTARSTIAIAREAGAPGTSVAREVGARLGWLVYDHELLERIAQEMGLRANLLASIDERRVSWLEEAVEQFAAVPIIGENSYVRRLIETILSLGTHGDCVIVGRGAPHILPAETTLRVRLVGLREDRIAATSRRLGISAEQAARWVEETDRERKAFIREHFRHDPDDARRYDLILNTSRWSIPECAELIIEALSRLQNRGQARISP